MPIRYSDTSGGGIPFGNNSSRPASPGIGKLYSNGEAQRLELYTVTGWQNIVSETPGVVSILGNYLESNASNSIEITGTNFVTGAIASAIGTNGVEVQANSTTVNSIVSISAVFSGLLTAHEPYDIKVTNTSNLFGILPDALYVNQSPVWQTPSGSLGTFDEVVSISVSATALDADSSVTYEIAQGSSLPTGLTLNQSSGLISGTLPTVNTDTTYSFTINATDGFNVIPRTFGLTSLRTLTLEYLLVAGGGAGGDFFTGSGYNAAGGGGGAGGYIYSAPTTLKASSFSFPITVGSAGVSTATSNTSGGFASNGGNTIFNGLTAVGGGRGAAGNSSVGPNVYTAGNGGSGGGGSRPDGGAQFAVAGTGTSNQGFSGGACNSSNNDGDGGGGGGATSAGTNGGVGSQGGAGYTSSITGTSVVYAAGGGGGDGLVGSWVGTGGSGVGGNGGVKQNNSPGGNASSFGCGGGGAGSSFSDTSAFSKGGNGSGGVVILAYPDTEPELTIPGTLTYDQPTRAGYRVYRFTAGSGTVTL